MKPSFDLNLYLVTDVPARCTLPLAETVEAAIAGGVSIVQYRSEQPYGGAAYREALPIVEICRKNGVPFIVNDRIDLALALDADGVHIGQKDHALTDVRKLLGENKIIGVSVQTVEQAQAACRDGADYLGVGAVFPTSTKSDADDVSYEALKAICAVSTVPVVAIGGISLENLHRLSGSGIDGIAVVSALFGAKDIAGAARKLRQGAAELNQTECAK